MSCKMRKVRPLSRPAIRNKTMRRRKPYRPTLSLFGSVMRVHDCLRFFKQHSYHSHVELMEHRAMVQRQFKRKRS